MQGREMRVYWTAFACLLSVCICTEEDAKMAGDSRNWRDLVVYLRKNGQDSNALRAGITCVRLNTSDAQCNTLVGSMLSFTPAKELDAISYFRRAAIASPSIRSMSNLGLALSRVYKNDVAAHVYEVALEMEVGSRDWLDTFYRQAEARQISCSNWEELGSRMERLSTALEHAIKTGMNPISPFLAMSLPLSARQVFSVTSAHATVASQSAEQELKTYERKSGLKLPFPLHVGVLRPAMIAPGDRRLRVVYLAAHFHRRKLMNGFLQSVWQLHDRSRTHVHCMAWADEPEDKGKPRGHDATPWIASQVETFIDLRDMSDLAIAHKANEVEADVLVELAGWYPEQRSSIVAMRPSRVQTLYRFIGTGGGRGDDLYVSDSTSFPPELQHLAVERLVYLQPLYLASSHQTTFPRLAENVQRLSSQERRALARQRTRLGSEQGALLGALNKPYKFTPEMFDVWSRLLREIPSAKLVVIQYKHYWEAPENLRAEAAKRNIMPNRVVAAAEGNHSFFLELGAAMDIFLDTSHPLSNGHTTVADMLWAGVPVVTFAGPAKPSRVAASIIKASRCASSLARNLEDYAAVAAALFRRVSACETCGCQLREEVYGGGFFMARWRRALFAMAEFPDSHIVIPEQRQAVNA